MNTGVKNKTSQWAAGCKGLRLGLLITALLMVPLFITGCMDVYGNPVEPASYEDAQQILQNIENLNFEYPRQPFWYEHYHPIEGNLVLYLPLYREDWDYTTDSFYSFDIEYRGMTVFEATHSSSGRLFDGTDDFIISDTISDTEKSFGISFWFYRSVDSGGNEYLFDTGSSWLKGVHVLIDTSDKLQLRMQEDGGAYRIASVTNALTISTSTWYHAEGSILSVSGELFISLSLNQSSNATSYYPIDDYQNPRYTNYNIGRASAGAGAWNYAFNGYIDDFHVYSSKVYLDKHYTNTLWRYE